MEYSTELEAFWAGEHGDKYNVRNKSKYSLSNNLSAFSQMLKRADNIKSVMELGAGIGDSLIAVRHLLPDVSLSGVEINKEAYQELKKIPDVDAVCSSIDAFSTEQTYDLVLTKGLLIHIMPEQLPDIYKKIIQLSKRWILLCEYYNPTPVAVNYQGHKNRLFKRDFCSEIIELSSHSLRLADYGFIYHGDLMWNQDDVNWFLLEKR